jgi:hypothetical protein
MLLLLAPLVASQEPEAIDANIAKLVIGNPITYKNLTIFPLTRHLMPSIDYVSFDEAMKYNWLTIKEIDNGEVNAVQLKNNGNKVVFIMTGEMLSGAKQDRMVKDDILIPAKSDWLEVPVYCVEHGRWVSVSPAFKSPELMAPNELRNRARITEDQSEVWDAIASSQDRLGIASSTRTAQANYEDEDTKAQIAEYTKALANMPRLTKNTVGICVTTGDRIICIDIFANNGLLMKYWNKLLKSYVLDAIHETKSVIEKAQIQGLLDALSHAHYASVGTSGLGDLYKIDTDFGKGSALVHKDRLVHMDFFVNDMPVDGELRLDLRREQRLND